ncbi:hypothetical protein PsorP6_018651 [Peronosclerospora sorghi]|nr:hypothetical protein PsorP6_018651 [Peronosclerospora sorghi]
MTTFRPKKRRLQPCTIPEGLNAQPVDDLVFRHVAKRWICILIDHVPYPERLPRSVVCRVVPRACDKIGDKKATKAVHDLILSLCESTSPAYTMGCLMASMPNVCLPLAHLEAMVELLDGVQDFGVAMCHPRALMEYAKGPQGLELSNPKVRSAAIFAKRHVLAARSRVASHLESRNLEASVSGDGAGECQATVKKKDQEDAAPSRDDAAALFGRVDVSSHVTKEILDKLKNDSDKGAWKQCSEALDMIQAICERAGCAIAFTRPVQDMVWLLKARLSDANANLKFKAANVLGVGDGRDECRPRDCQDVEAA